MFGIDFTASCAEKIEAKNMVAKTNKTKYRETEIGKIPEDWDLRPIGSLVSINESSIKKGYPHSEIVYFDTSSVDNGQILGGKRLTIQKAPSRAKRIVKNNDILISTVRPNLRHFAFIKHALSNMIASTGFVVISSKNIIPEYLYYYLTTDKFTEYLTAIADAHTSTYPSFNPDVIEKSEIPFPTLNEQKSIAKILSGLDSKIDINIKMNKTLEAIGQALFKRWFVDFEFPNENGKPYKSSGGETVESELGKIPEGWRVGTLKEIIEMTSGKRPSDKSDTKSAKFNIPLIGASSIMGYVRERLYNEPILIIGRVGTHGIVQRISYPSFPSDNTLVIKSCYYNFIFHSLKRLDYNSLNVGTTQPLITQSGIKQMVLIIPQDAILRKFENVLIALYERVNRNLDENKNLSQIRDSLLPRLMSGRIRVPVS